MRVFGREGQGPGEFVSSLPLITVDLDDQIHVWEGPRRTVLQPDLKGFTRLSVDAIRPVTVAFAESTVAMTNSSGHAGYTTHIWRDGEIAAKGIERVDARTDKRFDLVRFVTPSLRNGFWIAKINRFEVELWSNQVISFVP